MPSLLQLGSYLVFAALAMGLVKLLHRWGHLLFYLFDYVAIKLYVWNFVRQHRTVADLFDDRVRSSPRSLAIVSDSLSLTYRQLDSLSSNVAQWALTHQYRSGDVIALIMDNKPEYIALWLGFAKIGVTVALINTALKSQSLLHSLRVCQTKSIIVSAELKSVIDDIYDQLYSEGVTVHVHGNNSDLTLTTVITNSHIDGSESSASVDWSSYRASLDSSSLLFYILTSGTTGLPKAAKIRHSRFYLAGVSMAQFFGIDGTDRIYNCLPLFHSVGGIVTPCMAWHTGATIILRKKFSASAFWSDCTNYDATVVMYIGQLCKYLVNNERSDYEKKHRVEKAIGNGMPSNVWQTFQSRFNVPYIGEFYASTEGNANLVNNRNKCGAIGYIPWIASLIYPIRIVQFDYLSEQPWRHPVTGRCVDSIEGELLGKISSDPLRSFDGYTNSKASQEKILTNVFRTNDAWFRTGDLVRIDSDGYIFFVDRIGDTFRWKGENVATTEVEAIVHQFPLIDQCNVYGVLVGTHTGRAGMACIVLKPECAQRGLNASELSELYAMINRDLPHFSQPLFLRVSASMEVTGTFKQRKVELVAQGFNPAVIFNDRLYFRDDGAKTFVPLDSSLYQRIVDGEVRV